MVTLPLENMSLASPKRCDYERSNSHAKGGHFAADADLSPHCSRSPPPHRRARPAAWDALHAFAELDYHATLPGTEDRLIERIGAAGAVLNIRSSTRFTGRVFAACPSLRLLSVWGTGTDHVDLAAAARHGVTVTNTPG